MIQIRLNSNAQAVVATLRSLPDKMSRAIAGTMDSQNELTVGHITANYLTGPRPAKLGRVTGTLGRSIRRTPARIGIVAITSSIGTNVSYAPIHEYGFAGSVTVRPHSRRTSRKLTVADAKGKRRTRKVQGRDVFVRSFTREVNMPARPFVQPGIRDRADAYGTAISNAIVKAWDGRT